MGIWTLRTSLYKAAFLLAVLNMFAYVLAFSIPMWLGWNLSSYYGYNYFIGLWHLCYGKDYFDIKECDEMTFDSDTEYPIVQWLVTVRVCWVGGLVSYLLGVLFGFVQNCCVQSRPKHDIMGAFVLLAGVCGTVGVILTAVKVADEDFDEYLWGYMVACGTSALAVLLGILLTVSALTSRQAASGAGAGPVGGMILSRAPSDNHPHQYNNASFSGNADVYQPQQQPYHLGSYSDPTQPGNSMNNQSQLKISPSAPPPSPHCYGFNL